MAKYGATISAPAMTALSASAILDAPYRIALSAGQLDRKVYEEVNEVLSRLGGKWTSGKVKAHVFNLDPTRAFNTVLETGLFPAGLTVNNNPYDYFPTPAELALKIAEEALQHIHGGMRVLEPSAGQGAIVEAIRQVRGIEDAEIVAVEIDAHHVPILTGKFGPAENVAVVNGDFLLMDASHLGQFDAIPMNPPFTAEKDALAYITHINHAWQHFLKRGGVLVSVTPAGWLYRQDRRCVEFRAFVEAHGKYVECESGAFKASGTGVKTAYVVLKKPI